ncbi:MauE/DoxX family redox-associated membrane protein [Pseudonocardia acaciae]|uniref:MauE/DoxX family redox-associated membrane protein n=1 Tax=Pseudonocardia acaciae TaxID=551276 RepID=UPI00048DC4A1|nr:MauE/DoxX family redox-associated membrane protein [Pseudonocardia acaciae]
MTYVVLGSRTLLAGVFLVSLAGKLGGRRAFRSFVAATAALLAVQTRSARVLAPLTVAGEGAVVVALALPGLVWVGFVVAAALLCCFSVVLAGAIRRGTRTPCRCFGAGSAPVGGHQMVRNLVLVAVAAVGLVGGLTAGGDRGYEPAGVALVAVVAAVCVLVTARLDDLVALLRPGRKASDG